MLFNKIIGQLRQYKIPHLVPAHTLTNESTEHPAPILLRLLAKTVDLVLFLLLFHFISVFSVWLSIGFAILYWAVVDYLHCNQSLGKHLFRLRIVTISPDNPLDYRKYAFRNLPLSLAAFFYCFPFWGWYLNLILFFPFILVEIILMYVMSSKTRLMDILADSRVILDHGQNKTTN